MTFEPSRPLIRQVLAELHRQHTLRLLAVLAIGAAAGCDASEPRTSIHSLDWACGDRRCTVRFMLTNDGGDDENLLVRVRAYAGSDVASREPVGEHKERLYLKSRGAKRYNVTVDTERPAQLVRVVIQRNPD